MWPRKETQTQQRDALTLTEFIDYLNGLAAVHEDTGREFRKPVFTHTDFAAMLRKIARWRP